MAASAAVSNAPPSSPGAAPPLPSGQPRWLFGYADKGRCGFIDRQGKVVIRPRYKKRYCFRSGFRSDGLIAVQQQRLVGYLDGTGRLVIPFATRQASVFSEGLLADYDASTRKFGYVDRRQKIVIPHRWDCALPFGEGLAAVCVGRKFGFVNRLGKVVVTARYKRATGFRNGLAVVETDRGPAVIDKTGRTVIPARGPKQVKLLGTNFSEGLAVALAPGRSMECGYMNRKGKIVIPTKFPFFSCKPFSEGLAVVRARTKDKRKLHRGKVGYIRQTGAWAIKPRFENGRRFSGGLAPVAVGRRWGFIDKRGALVIPLRYTDARPFGHGLARVSVDNEWRYIDRTGRTVWSPPSAQVAGQQVSFTSLGKGGNARQPKGQFLVLRDQAGLQRQWKIAYLNHGHKPPAPVVDFQKYDVLAIYQGAKPSTGYSMRISRVVDSGPRVTVVVKEWRPTGGCMTGRSMTYAWHMVRVERKNKPYKFITRQLDSCSRRRR